MAVFCGQAHPFARTRPFGVVAAALDLSRRSPDPRKAAIGALLTGDGTGAPARAAGDIQYRVVEEIVDRSRERPVCASSWSALRFPECRRRLLERFQEVVH